MDLTPRQFALLGAADAAGRRGAAQGEILEHVWDFSFEGDPNIVEVYVRQLRHRIDQPFGRTALQTVRGGLPARPRGWLNRVSLRARTTLLVAVVTAALLLGGAVSLDVVLRHGLTDWAGHIARSRVADLLALAESGDLPDRARQRHRRRGGPGGRRRRPGRRRLPQRRRVRRR